MNEPSVVDALRLSENFPVYPLARHSVVPPKGTNGHLGATQDKEKIVDYFTEIAPEGNIGASLIDTPYFVVDIDRKSAKQDGLISLSKHKPPGAELENTVIVKTKSGGLHLWYRTTEEIKHQIGWLEHVDILKNGVIMPPSVAVNAQGKMGKYTLTKGSFSDIKEPPQWLLNAILQSQQEKRTDAAFTLNYQPPSKKYTAKLIEEVVNGSVQGGRNDWLAGMVGKFLYLGTDTQAAYELTHVINENFISPPLKDAEVNKIFSSIVKREAGKQVKNA